MRNQIKFTFQIGYPVQSLAFEHSIASAASRICGGCTTSTAIGWWCEDGDERKERFTAPAASEHTFQLELTCEAVKAENAYQEMCQSIADIVAAHGIATNWVHVSETEMRGRHFSVDAINAAKAVAAQ